MTARRPFAPETDGPLLSAYVDGELDDEQRELVEHWLDDDARVREEIGRLVRLKAFTDHLRLREPPREAWDDFRRRVVNRRERSLGWTLLLFGGLVIGGYALLRLALVLITAAIPLVVRLGVVLGGIGLLVLLVSVVRERWFVRKRDRYDDVVR
ncbi:MAG TPA: hypothetical protein PLL30_11720 [Candidatus Krumholzibacteria bacterium]|nr:hypothetical protein [Candidatus Krumholzibacteria bacterium]HPD72434.1 hypothetical protein [Candidatus Krumholzibacteria bacterium]HRY40634.1 hypothetical protein [Candidatus Krumholzibacteria bacterium]